MGGGHDNGDGGDDEDEIFMNTDPIATFAKPIVRKKKKHMDFTRSKELSLGDKSKLEGTMFFSTDKQEKDRKAIETADKSEEKSGEVSLASMELDYSEPLHLQDNGKDISPVSFKNEVELMLINDQIDVEKNAGDDIALPQSLKRREQTYSTSSPVSCTGSDLGNEQGTMTLESEIDDENHARLQIMSSDEIEEAQAEIMEKLNPSLLKLLKKRGEEKLKQKKVSTPDISSNRECKNVQNEDNNDAKSSTWFESGTTHTVAKTTSDDSHDGLDDRGRRNSIPANSSLWNAWSERVEAIRDLRFSLDGTLTGSDLVQVPETGEPQ